MQAMFLDMPDGPAPLAAPPDSPAPPEPAALSAGWPPHRCRDCRRSLLIAWGCCCCWVLLVQCYRTQCTVVAAQCMPQQQQGASRTEEMRRRQQHPPRRLAGPTALRIRFIVMLGSLMMTRKDGRNGPSQRLKPAPVGLCGKCAAGRRCVPPRLAGHACMRTTPACASACRHSPFQRLWSCGAATPARSQFRHMHAGRCLRDTPGLTLEVGLAS